MPPDSPRSHPARLPAALVLLVACAFALLRFVRLGEWSLWIDEAFTWADAHHSLGSSELFNPLGYRMVVWVATLGGAVPDEFGLRLLPAIAGVACVPLTAWALGPVLGRRRAAWAALFLSLSAWHLFWSQTARFYTLAQLTVLIGAGLALRGMWGGGRVKTYSGLALCGAASIFHPSAALLIPALALGAWLSGGEDPARRKRAREVWIVLVVAGLGALPLALRPLLNHLTQKPAAGALQGVAHLVATSAYFFTPFLAAAALWAAWIAWRRREPVGRFFTGVAVGELGVALLIATRAQVTAQYVFVLLPFVCGLVASLLSDDGEERESPRTEGALAVGLVLASIANCALYLTSRQGERPKWREAYQYVESVRSSGDLVAGMAAPIGEFYLGGHPTDLRHSHAVAPIGRFHGDGPRRWRRDGRRTWIVVRPQWFADMREDDAAMLREFLAHDCRLMRRYDVPMDGRDLTILVYLEEG